MMSSVSHLERRSKDRDTFLKKKTRLFRVWTEFFNEFPEEILITTASGTLNM